MTATINIGLAIGDGTRMVDDEVALAAILTCTGDRPITYALVVSITERTLVAVLEEPATIGALWQLCEELEQDCIAQQDEGHPGQLVGPRAAEWGPFDPARFIDWAAARELV